ncbi:MAG: rhomboid family intramembrane serine protease [bacterium]|nr:rhomboid family intramembrane serine protease [bacterium]
MNTSYQTYRFGFGGGLTSAVRKLIIINVIIFLVQMISPVFYNYFVRYFGLVPYDLLHKAFIWQLGSYMFLHGGFFHILFNMFFLWMFGSEIEREWGTKEFYKYYFITGIGAGVFNVLFQPNSTIPIVGASGAIYGLLVAFGMMYPNRPILFMFLFPIPAKIFVIFMGVFAFFSAFNSQGDNIAHFAHLGGLVVGYLYLQFKWKIDRAYDQVKSKVKYPHLKIHKKPKEPEDNMRKRIDEILDKINSVGYENLTEEEKTILQNAGDYLNRNR